MSVVGLGLGITASANFEVAVEAEVIRKKIGVSAEGNAQVDTAQSKFGGSSALFDGSSDYLYVPGGQGIDDSSTDFTLEAFVRFDILPQNQTIGGGSFMMFATVGSTTYISLDSSDGSKIRVQVADSGTYMNFDSTTTNWATGTWYHVAIVRESNQYDVYVDGVALTRPATSTKAGGWAGADANIIIGKFTDSRGSFDGNIDEFRISDTARYTTTFTPTTTPFVNDDNTKLLLHMNGTDGSTFFEDDNGVGRSSVGVRALGGSIDTAQSKFGGSSAEFTGSSNNGLFMYQNNVVLSGSDFTIEGFVRFQDAGADSHAVFAYGYSPFSTGEFFLAFDQSSPSMPEKFNLFYSGSYYSGTTTYSYNTWYHVAFVRNGTSIKVYVDGVEEISGTTATNLSANQPWFIGTLTTGGQATVLGHMDEVRISDTARYTTGFTAPTAPFVNDDNTILLLHMDGTDASTDFRDDNGNAGTYSTGRNVPVSVFGDAQIDTAQSKFGGASLLLDGNGDYLMANDAIDSIVNTDEVTIEAWVYQNSYSSGAYWFAVNSGAASSGNNMLVGPASIWVTGASENYSTAISTTGTWIHIAYVYDGAGGHKVYKDGTLHHTWSTTRYNTTSWSGLDFGIGVEFDAPDGGSPGNYFNGYMDELRVSNVMRYTANFTPSTDAFVNDSNTLLLLHMDGDDSSTVFKDDDGGLNTRTPVGVSAEGNAQVDTAQSKYGGASALFDGTGDYLRVYNEGTLSLGTGDWTIETWVYRNGTQAQNNSIICSGFSASTTNWQLSFTQPGVTDHVIFFYDNNTYIESASPISNQTWTHIAVSRSGSTVRLFVDGVLDDSATLSNNYSDTSDLRIGVNRGGTAFLNGNIDELRISNTARYTAAFTPDTTPFQNDANTLLLLHMDGTDGSTVFIDDNGKHPPA